MLRSFHTDKIIFEIRQAYVPLNSKESFKLFYDNDYALPLGRVRLFKNKNRIYGRIQYYKNLSAYRNNWTMLQHLYPSLTLLEENGKAVKILCAALTHNKNTDGRIHQVGVQLFRRAAMSAGWKCHKEALEVLKQNEHIEATLKQHTGDTMLQFFALGFIHTLLLDNETYEPLKLKYPGLAGKK